MATAHIFVNQTAGNEISMDFSPWVSALAQPEAVYGHAFLTTLGTLGLEQEIAPESPSGYATLRIRGSLEIARLHLTELQQQRDAVAAAAAQKEIAFQGYNRRKIADIIDTLATTTLPDLDARTPLTDLGFTIAYPFGKELHEKGVTGHTRGCKAPWRASDVERAVQAKKQSLHGPAALYCIPTTPDIPPEEELAQLNSLPDQRSWFERKEEQRQLALENQSIEFLRSRGFTVERADALRS